MERYLAYGKKQGGLAEGRSLRLPDWKRLLSHPAADWVIGGILSACAAFLCYRSVFGLLSACAILPMVHKIRRQDRLEEADRACTRIFCDAMQEVSAALASGSSLEQAFLEAEGEIRHRYGKSNAFVRGFSLVNQQVRMNQALEECFLAFADAGNVTEIIHFAETFRYAKRNGANMPRLIRVTVDRIREKEAVLADIQTMITAKRLEQRMLLLMVPGVLLFLTVSSPEYTQTLYHSPAGVLLMTGCLAGYLLAAWWGRKIVSIRV